MRYFLRRYETPLGMTDAIMAITDDGMILGIPNDWSNSDCVAYLIWLAEGNEPQEWQPEEAN